MASQLSSYILAVSPISPLADPARISGMTDLKRRYDHYAARLRAYMDARNITGEAAAELVSAHPTTVYDLRRGEQKLDDEWRARFAQAFGIEEDLLFGRVPLPAPRPVEVRPRKKRGRKPKAANDNVLLAVYGLAAGSLAGAFTQTSEEIYHVKCPPALADVSGAYALRTHGESMVPRYMPGDILYVNPHQKVAPGDHVIIQTMLHDNSGTETWVKRYDGEETGEVKAWQYSPPAAIRFRKRFIKHIHRVLPVNELFGDAT